MKDPEDLDRFLDAQSATYDTARAEIASGRKRTHWIWWIFPQLRGLGKSDTATFYGIAGPGEAQRYLEHPTLGARLVETAQLMLAHAGRPPEEILGETDAIKLRSCATLFSSLPNAPDVFRQLLDTFYDGDRDPRTDAMLGTRGRPR